MKSAIFCAIAIVFLSACSKDSKPKEDKPKEGFSLFSKTQPTFTVTDEMGLPLVAEVLVGDKLNDPPNNMVYTDPSGVAPIPDSWTDTQPVTVRVPGYVAVTYLQQNPRSLSFRLRKAPTLNRMELTGTTRGYTIKDKDDIVDFGLVMKGLSKPELLAFDISKVISNDMDSISVAGQSMSVPSNVSLPRQKESYFLFTVTLDKNPYRLSFFSPGPQKVVALKGRFPFKKTVDELRSDRSFVELINLFSIEGGTLQDVDITASNQKLDLNVSELNFKQSINIKAPRVSQDEVILALAAQNMDGILVPTDIKRLSSGQSVKLKSLDPADAVTLQVLKRESEFNTVVASNMDRISAIFAPASQPIETDFLNLVENPRVQGQDLVLDAPKPVAGVNEYSTYLILSELHEVQMGNNKVVLPLHRWEVYAPGWIPQMTLPQRPFSNASKPQWRWEVSFLGGVEATGELGPEMIEKTTHVTRSSTDF